MLLLAHHEHETIILETSDGPIEVRLSRLDGPQARIGIDAPKSVRIIRKDTADGGMPADLSQPAEPLPLEALPVEALHTESDEEPWWRHPDEVEG